MPVSADAGEGYVPPPVGMKTSILYRDLDYNDFFRLEIDVISNGPDYALMRLREFDTLIGKRISYEDFFVEFAGYFLHYCEAGVDLPGSETRQKAIDFWPLEVGASTELETGYGAWRYDVDRKDTIQIGTDGPTDVMVVKGTDLNDTESYSETLYLSAKTRSVVRVEYADWGEETRKD